VTIEQRSVLARDQVVFAGAQSTLDTMTVPAAGDAMRVTKCAIAYEQAREDRMDNRQSAGLVKRISGKRAVTAEIEEYLRASGSAGTAPDDQDLWQSLFGTETVNGGTSVVYTFSSTQARQLISLHQAHGTTTNCDLLQSIVGMAIAKLKIGIQGNNPVKLAWSGVGRRLVTTGPVVLNGAMSASTTMVIATADTNSIEVDSVVAVGATTGNRVTAKTGASCTLTSAATASDGASVMPYVPAETLSGEVIAGIDGSFTLVGPAGSASVYILAAEVEIDVGIKAYDDEYGSVHVTDFGTGWRKVTGSVTFRVRRDQIQRILAAKNDSFTARAMTIVCGGSAGSTLTLSIPYAELSFRGIEFPENGDESTVQVPFVALASGDTANDELSATFT
jgi:hypothetical protein